MIDLQEGNYWLMSTLSTPRPTPNACIDTPACSSASLSVMQTASRAFIATRHRVRFKLGSVDADLPVKVIPGTR